MSSLSMPVTDPSMEDTDFSETVKFISEILMEENVDQRLYYDPFSLQVTEKSFYHALIHDGGNGTTSISNNRSSNDTSTQPSSTEGLIDLDSSITNLLAQNIFSDAHSVSQFKRGLEEANKCLPPQPRLLTGLEPSNSNMVGDNSSGLKGRKNHDREESDVKEGRSNKQSALDLVVDEEGLSEMFDKILLDVEPLPLNRDMMNKFRNKMREWDHKEFVFDEDNNWMLLGWKGRVLYASTCWVAAAENSCSQN